MAVRERTSGTAIRHWGGVVISTDGGETRFWWISREPAILKAMVKHRRVGFHEYPIRRCVTKLVLDSSATP